MKTRTLVAVLIVVVVLAAGAVVLLGDGEGAVAMWLKSLHGSPGRSH